MRPRSLLAVVLVATGGACGDLFHGTDWPICDRPDARCSSVVASGGHGSAAGGGGGVGPGGSGTGGAAAVTYGSACDAYAASLCPRLAECRPVRYALEGGQASCIEVVRDRCTRVWSGTGYGMTPEGLGACFAALDLSTASCSTISRYYEGQLSPAACEVAGTRGNGEACAHGAQCKDLGCGLDGSGPCGVCSTKGKKDDACDAVASCAAGFRCTNAACVALGDLGSPCATTDDCYVDLYCDGASCAARIPLGADCASGLPCVVDAFCGLTATCESFAVAALGESCGGFLTTVCSHGSFCQAAVAEDIQTCAAQGTEGQPCPAGPSTFGSTCAPPASCLGGTCIVLDGSKCM